ncbi:MAG: hypothetical protein N2202_03485 [Proteobacteria bacterium]|nr:hypothetical protein [Pseudomonadota bacterium]
MKNVGFLILFLFFLFTPITLLAEGFSGSISYTYQEDKIDYRILNKEEDNSYFLQRYNLDYSRLFLLQNGALGTFDMKLGLGYDAVDRDFGGKSSHSDKFRKRWYLDLVIAPRMLPLFFEVLTENVDSQHINPDTYEFTDYSQMHNKVTFKYVMPRYFNFFDPRGNGNGNGNFFSGNGNGLLFSGNGNGMFFLGSGNGGLLGNGGSGNGFFLGNGNGGNGNGGGVFNRRVGPLTPYAYLFEWENFITDGDNIEKTTTNRYTLNLGFLKFWINASYYETDDGVKKVRETVEIGQRRYDGRLLWTLVNNWIASSSFFVYQLDKDDNKVSRESYEGNFIFKTIRKDWRSDLLAKFLYEKRPLEEEINVKLPYYFYGSTSLTNSYSGTLSYEFDKIMRERAEDTQTSKAINNFSITFRKGDWSYTSRHDLIYFTDNTNNSTGAFNYDYLTFNYDFSFIKNPSLISPYAHEGGYTLTVHDYLTNSIDKKIKQIHTARYKISGPINPKLGFSLSEQLSYYDEGSIPVTNENYIAQNRVYDIQLEPYNTAIRNITSASLSYIPITSMNLTASGTVDDVFYDNGTHESRRTIKGMASYYSFDRTTFITAEAGRSVLQRVNNDDEANYFANLQVLYTPRYNFSSKTTAFINRSDRENGVDTFTENKGISEEITYAIYTNDYYSRKIFDMRAFAKYEKYMNLTGFVSDKFVGSNPSKEKTLVTLEGAVNVYPLRFLTIGGRIKEEKFKEEDDYKDNLTYTLRADLTFPLLSISSYYQHKKIRIDGNRDEDKFYINLTKRF